MSSSWKKRRVEQQVDKLRSRVNELRRVADTCRGLWFEIQESEIERRKQSRRLWLQMQEERHKKRQLRDAGGERESTERSIDELSENIDDMKVQVERLNEEGLKAVEEMSNLKREKEEVEAEISFLEAQIAQMELPGTTSSGDDYFNVIARHGSPSSLAKASNWRRAQEKLSYLCHIPPEAEPPFPLTLAHPAFGKFVDRFHSSRIEFDSQVCELVGELCFLVAKDFKDERQKMEEFNKLMGNYLGEAIKPVVVASSYPTDGSVLFKEYMVYLEEGKKDEGTSLFQAMQYYALFLMEMPQDKAYCTFSPCFLVELVGFHIRISGLAFFSKVACQPFTPFMHCYFNSYDKADMDSLCRAMLALKKGVSELMEYYNPHPPTVDKRIPYPLQKHRYVQRIDKRLLFVVEMEQSGDRRLFKFCKQYGKRVHEIWAQAGLAPKLFECREIPGGWFAVEMEYLSSEDWKSVHEWCSRVPQTVRSNLRSAVCSALQRAFALKCELEYLSADDWKTVQQLCSSVSKCEESALLLAVEKAVRSVLKLKHEIAHGDMRPPNVMARVQKDGFEIKFVDFDWAGVVSGTFYPSFINTEQNWHEGVQPGMPLSQDHDIWWWRQDVT